MVSMMDSKGTGYSSNCWAYLLHVNSTNFYFFFVFRLMSFSFRLSPSFLPSFFLSLPIYTETVREKSYRCCLGRVREFPTAKPYFSKLDSIWLRRGPCINPSKTWFHYGNQSTQTPLSISLYTCPHVQLTQQPTVAGILSENTLHWAPNIRRSVKIFWYSGYGFMHA